MTKRIALVLVMVAQLFAIDYYVNGSVSVSGDGSFDYPFKTIQEGINVAYAGDIVYIQEGTYVLTSGLDMVRSGNEGAPIIFTNYQDDVVILDMTSLSDKDWDWHGYKDYLVIDGLTFLEGRWPVVVQGSHNEIAYCTFDGSSSTAINVWGGSHNHIHHNEVLNFGWNGVGIESRPNDGAIGNADYNIVEWNHIHHSTGHFGVNIFPNTGQAQELMYGNIIRYNNLHDFPTNGGMYLRRQVDGEIYYNLIYNCDEWGIFLHWRDSGDGAHDSNLKVYNNTIVNTGYDAFDNHSHANVELKNNIFEVWNSTQYATDFSSTVGTSGHDIDYNMSYNLVGGVGDDLFGWENLNLKYSLLEQQNNLGYSFNGLDARATFNSDYSLAEGSVGINAGVDVGLTHDLAGNPIVGAPDMGAFEFQTPLTLQEMVNALNEGETLIVPSNIYNERVIVTTNNIKLIAEDPVVVDGGFWLDANGVVIDGFEIINEAVVDGYGTSQREDGCGVYIEGDNCVVKNNYIHHTSYQGVYLRSVTNADSIVNNIFEWNGHNAIEIWGTNHVMLGNDISHPVRYGLNVTNATTDTDGMRYFGDGHLIKNNYIHDIYLTDQIPGSVQSNAGSHIDCAQTWGPATNITFDGNVFINPQANYGQQTFMTEQLVGTVSDLTFINNVFSSQGTAINIDNKTTQGDIDRIKIINNTFYLSWRGAQLFGCPDSEVKNNLFYDNPVSYLWHDATGGTDISYKPDAGYNAHYATDGEPYYTPDPNDLWDLDPLIVDIDELNFRLTEESPLIDHGTSVDIIIEDNDGTVRPQGLGIDIGAYEFDFGDDSSLPVELTSFTATTDNNTVTLRWTTASEMENLGFIVDRKFEDENWITIDSYQTNENLIGQGTTSSETDYTYVDGWFGHSVKYRLADVGYDGYVHFLDSTELVVTSIYDNKIMGSTELLGNYPNPFNATTTIAMYVRLGQVVKIQVFNIKGQEVYSINKYIEGRQQVTIDMGDLPSGVYMYRMTTDNKVFTKKMILLK